MISGRKNMLWPGLNAPVLQGSQVVKMRKLPEDPEREKRILQKRDEMSRIRYKSLPPLLRGWSGPWLRGQSVGPPDPVGDCKH